MATSDQQPGVELLIRSPALRQAMESYLDAKLGVRVVPRLNDGGGDMVVVTTSSDISPGDCAVLAGGGARVLVLLAFASEPLVEAYQSAGATGVLLMGTDGLEGAVRSLLAPGDPEADASETADPCAGMT